MRLLDVQQSGIVQHMEVREGTTIIKSSQDIEAVLNENTIKRNQSQSGWKGDLHHVASVPMIMKVKWDKELKDKGASNTNCFAKEHELFFMNKIRDYNFSKFRVKEGRI